MKTDTHTTTAAPVPVPVILHDGQEIRIQGFSPYAQKIAVHTARGYAARHNQNPEEAHADALANGHATAWVYQEPAILTADYKGKAAALEAAAAATAAAPVIAHRDVVEIEGELFRVLVTGERYSDPAALVRAIA